MRRRKPSGRYRSPRGCEAAHQRLRKEWELVVEARQAAYTRTDGLCDHASTRAAVVYLHPQPHIRRQVPDAWP